MSCANRTNSDVSPSPTTDSPRALRIRESAAAMLVEDPELPLEVALDRADALESLAEEREAEAQCELEHEACAAHDPYSDHSRCERGFCTARSSYGYHD